MAVPHEVQANAIKNLELSLADDRPRALAAITMGGGKTRFAISPASPKSAVPCRLDARSTPTWETHEPGDPPRVPQLPRGEQLVAQAAGWKSLTADEQARVLRLLRRLPSL
jgi:hypothetical protein